MRRTTSSISFGIVRVAWISEAPSGECAIRCAASPIFSGQFDPSVPVVSGAIIPFIRIPFVQRRFASKITLPGWRFAYPGYACFVLVEAPFRSEPESPTLAAGGVYGFSVVMSPPFRCWGSQGSFQPTRALFLRWMVGRNIVLVKNEQPLTVWRHSNPIYSLSFSLIFKRVKLSHSSPAVKCLMQ